MHGYQKVHCHVCYCTGKLHMCIGKVVLRMLLAPRMGLFCLSVLRLLWASVLCLLLLRMAGTSCTTLSLKSEDPVFWQLTLSPEPPYLWAVRPGTKASFTLLSQQWHRESVTWETWRNFPLVSRSPPVRQSESFWDISGWLRGSFSTVLE